MNIGALCSQKIVKTTKLVLGLKNSHVNAKIDATYEKNRHYKVYSHMLAGCESEGENILQATDYSCN